MAVIPDINYSQSTPQVVKQPGTTSPLEVIGKAAQVVGDLQLKSEAKEQESLAAKDFSDFQVKAAERFNQLSIERQENPDGFGDAYLQELDKMQETLVKNDKGSAYNDAIAARFQEFRARQGLRSAEFEADQKTTVQKNRLSAAADNMQALVYQDPEYLGKAIAELEGNYAMAQGTALMPDAPEKLRTAKEDLALSAIRAYADKGQVGKAQQILESNAAGGLTDRAAAEIQAAQKRIEAEAKERAREAELAAEREYDAKTEELTAMVYSNPASIGELERAYAGGKGWLSGADYRSLNNMYESRNKERLKSAEAVRLARDIERGEGYFDPNNTEHKSALDSYWKEESEKVEPQNRAKRLTQIVDKFGAVPESEMSKLRGQMWNAEPEKQAEAADTIQRLLITAPQAANSISREDVAFSSMIKRGVDVGLSPSRAVENAKKAKLVSDTPEYALRKKEVDTLVKDGEFDFDESDAPTAMRAEYQSTAYDLYLNFGMDADQAAETARQLVDSSWGETHVAGDRRYMKYAPEKIYSVKGASDEWINKSLKKSLSTVDGLPEDIDERLRISVHPKTINTATPAYQLSYVDDRGFEQPIVDKDGMPMLWVPDIRDTDELSEMRKRTRRDIEAALQLRVIKEITGQENVARAIEPVIDYATQFGKKIDAIKGAVGASD